MKQLLRKAFILVWRIWFYAWIFFTILFALPILVLTIYHDKTYPYFFKIARAWGKTILFAMGFTYSVEEEETTNPEQNYMYIANHTSLIDVMLMLAIMKNPAVFVGKSELRKIPVFGYVFRKTSILVDRKSYSSRKDVYTSAQEKLNKGLSIAIYPEGIVPEESVIMAPFKNGAFRMAIEHQIPIVPMTFYDCKKHLSWTFFSGGPGHLRVKVHSFIPTTGKTLNDLNALKEASFEIIHTELQNDAAYMETTLAN